MRWRLLLSPPTDGPKNMAVDHALMQRARTTGESVLRIYTWAVPTLSLGRNQRARGVYDDDALARRGIVVVRRPTGGRALLHHREITYSVTSPCHLAETLGATYSRINALLLSGLAALGVNASIARPTSRARAPGPPPCFAEPSAGEIVATGRKLVGSAQWREAGALLQHGSIIVDDDQSIIPELMRSPSADVPPPASLHALLGRSPDAKEVADAMFTVVRRTVDPSAEPLAEHDVRSLDVAAVIGHYHDPSWTWRR